MPVIVNDLLTLLAELIRLLGMAVLGLGLGWLVLDLLKKLELWQAQVAIFLGLVGLIIALAVFTGMGAFGAFAIGVGVAIFMWGMPKKEKKEEEKS